MSPETDPTDGGSSAAARRGRIGALIGGFVAGLYSVPEGIGYAQLAGINPMFGIYSGMVPVALAAAFTGSVLMMSTLTSAIALTMSGVLTSGNFSSTEVPRRCSHCLSWPEYSWSRSAHSDSVKS
jgi:MFS superfamily sulfate permease-like transporter